MEPMQIFVMVAIFAILVAAVVIAVPRLRKSSENWAETIDKLIEEYTDDVIMIAKDIIVISQVRRENCDTQEDYEQILMRMVARRLVELIYNDIEVDERFKEIINEETLLQPLIYLYRQYEENILKIAADEAAYIELPVDIDEK